MDSATALTRRDLEDRGFRGFVRFDELPSTDVPQASGIYVVLRSSSASPRFLATSPAGRRGDRDPTVSIEQLATKWVEGAHLVYIGKADAGAEAKHGLRRRLRQYNRSGTGSSGHWGGRYIWQLHDSSSLLVAWRTTREVDPAQVEADLIDEFIRLHGKPPFANLRRGNRDQPSGHCGFVD
ncbi:hypothetical protein ABZ759_30010 [Streptomyces sp. NPDC047860]|uniref:hypothetical protein n=1 Tax=Streptomyces sp. NPDC047860 TaxID=3155743 RepID=UPI0033CF2FCC